MSTLRKQGQFLSCAAVSLGLLAGGPVWAVQQPVSESSRPMNLWDQLDRDVEALSEAIRRNPQDGAALCARGVKYTLLRREFEAVDDFKRALDLGLEPELASDCHIGRALAYQGWGLSIEALADYALAIELRPGNQKAYLERARLYIVLEQYEPALADFATLIRLQPSVAHYQQRAGLLRKLGRLPEAIADYDAAIALEPSLAQLYQIRAGMLRELKQPDRVLDDYSQLIELQPLDPGPVLRRAEHYQDIGQIDAAIADYGKVLELIDFDGSHKQAFFGRGKIYYDQHRYAEARGDFRALVKLDPESSISHFYLGVIAYLSKQFAEAIYHFDDAIQGTKWSSSSYELRGASRSHLGLYTAALEDFDAALKLDPQSTFALSQRGFTHLRLDQFQPALQDLSTALRLDPKNFFAYYHRAQAFGLLRQPELALVDYTRALELKPDDASLYLARGMLQQRLERYEEALSDANRCLSLEPDNILALMMRAQTEHKLGQFSAALADYEQLIALGQEEKYYRGPKSILLGELGRLTEALEISRRRLLQEPNYRTIMETIVASYESLISILREAESGSVTAQTWLQIGQLHSSLSHYAAAAETLGMALSLDPSLTEARVLRSRALFNLNRYQQAYDEVAGETKNLDAEAWAWLAHCAEKINKLAEAEAAYSQALSFFPKHSYWLAERGQIRAARGNFEGALADLNRSIEGRDNPNVYLFLDRAEAYLALKQYPEAEVDFRRFIAAEKDWDAIAERGLGKSLLARGKYSEALEAFKRALAKRPGLADVYQLRAQALQALGQASTADADLQTACLLGLTAACRD